MTKPKKKIINTVLEDVQYTLEGNVVAVRDRLNDLINKYGTKTQIDIGIEHEYGGEYVYVHLKGDREETDVEFKQRVEREERYKKTQDERDAAEYIRLQAKFKDKQP